MLAGKVCFAPGTAKVVSVLFLVWINPLNPSPLLDAPVTVFVAFTADAWVSSNVTYVPFAATDPADSSTANATAVPNPLAARTVCISRLPFLYNLYYIERSRVKPSTRSSQTRTRCRRGRGPGDRFRPI